ncbi:putative otopetrin [Operophtera brumata]|uniref:Putative otopetrin n=1 Tax=Operophtera brumata TaxID=104452 RepID=A0A0L7LCQ2_OPEBR|nr:putative otopetrin [Operophtera brumata]
MPLRDRRKVPTPSPRDSRRVFVACYSGPIYCDAPPDIGAPESSASLTAATTQISVSGPTTCDAPPGTGASESNAAFTAAATKPSDSAACNAPPDTGAAESNAAFIAAATKTSVSVAQNSGHLYFCDNVRIIRDNTTECEKKRKPNDSKTNKESYFRISEGESLKTEVTPPKKIRMNTDLIDEHILSYKLIINRDTTPVSRYLPRHLTVNAMYDDFKCKYPSVCSESLYRQQIRKINVITQPNKSEKNCAECLMYEAMTQQYQKHKTGAESAITKFYSDSCKALTHSDKAADTVQKQQMQVPKYYSMALQKDILLPDMPVDENVCKDYFRVSKLVCFNMTFAPLPGSKDPSFCVIWHEALAGRNYNNIVDAIVSLIRTEKDVVDFNFWAEDTALYKNWTLFMALTILVNSKDWQTQTITINYLTKGHIDTKSPDSMHSRIENKMKKEKIYDFNNIKEIFESMRNVKVVEVNQFGDWPKNTRNDPKMDNLLPSMVEVKFVRGFRKLLYNTNFKEPNMTELHLPVGDYRLYCPINALEEDDIIGKRCIARTDAQSLQSIYSICLCGIGFAYILFLMIDISRYKCIALKNQRIKESYEEEYGLTSPEIQGDGSPEVFRPAVPPPAFIPLKHQYCFSEGRHAESFYLKLGASGFAIGHLVHSMLQITVQLGFLLDEDINNDGCINHLATVLDFMIPCYCILQLYFIFKYSNVIILRSQCLAHFAMMHMIGSSLCFWIFAIVRETTLTLAIYAHSVYGNGNNGSQKYSDEQIAKKLGKLIDIHDLYNKSCTGSAAINTIIGNLSPYLFPFSVEFNILIVAVYYIIWSNIGNCDNYNKTSSETNSALPCKYV